MRTGVPGGKDRNEVYPDGTVVEIPTLSRSSLILLGSLLALAALAFLRSRLG